MSVYIDDAFIPYGRMLMCHMIADTRVELLSMADRIGVARRWIQHEGKAREHFDVAKNARMIAIAVGAIAIDGRRLARMLQQRKADRSLEFTPDARARYFAGGEI